MELSRKKGHPHKIRYRRRWLGGGAAETYHKIFVENVNIDRILVECYDTNKSNKCFRKERAMTREEAIRIVASLNQEQKISLYETLKSLECKREPEQLRQHQAV